MRVATIVICVWVGSALASVGALALLSYVLFHFINKVW